MLLEWMAERRREAELRLLKMKWHLNRIFHGMLYDYGDNARYGPGYEMKSLSHHRKLLQISRLAVDDMNTIPWDSQEAQEVLYQGPGY